MMKQPANIVPRPCCDEVSYYLSRFDGIESYSLQESALRKLSHITYPDNSSIDDVLVKVSVLNGSHHNPDIFPIYDSYVDKMLKISLAIG